MMTKLWRFSVLLLGVMTGRADLATNETLTCAPGWKRVNNHSECMRLTTHATDWYGAKRQCQDYGGSLFDGGYNRTLLTTAAKFFAGEGQGSDEHLWVNAHYINVIKGGVWVYKDDTPMTYFNWTFLDGAVNIGSENFIAMRSSDGKWTDEANTIAKVGQICQDITTEKKEKEVNATSGDGTAVFARCRTDPVRLILSKSRVNTTKIGLCTRNVRVDNISTIRADRTTNATTTGQFSIFNDRYRSLPPPIKISFSQWRTFITHCASDSSSLSTFANRSEKTTFGGIEGTSPPTKQNAQETNSPVSLGTPSSSLLSTTTHKSMPTPRRTAKLMMTLPNERHHRNTDPKTKYTQFIDTTTKVLSSQATVSTAPKYSIVIDQTETTSATQVSTTTPSHTVKLTTTFLSNASHHSNTHPKNKYTQLTDTTTKVLPNHASVVADSNYSTPTGQAETSSATLISTTTGDIIGSTKHVLSSTKTVRRSNLFSSAVTNILELTKTGSNGPSTISSQYHTKTRDTSVSILSARWREDTMIKSNLSQSAIGSQMTKASGGNKQEVQGITIGPGTHNILGKNILSTAEKLKATKPSSSPPKFLQTQSFKTQVIKDFSMTKFAISTGLSMPSKTSSTITTPTLTTASTSASTSTPSHSLTSETTSTSTSSGHSLPGETSTITPSLNQVLMKSLLNNKAANETIAGADKTSATRQSDKGSNQKQNINLTGLEKDDNSVLGKNLTEQGQKPSMETKEGDTESKSNNPLTDIIPPGMIKEISTPEAIASLSVGGVVFLLIIVGMILAVVYRKKSTNPKVDSVTDSTSDVEMTHLEEDCNPDISPVSEKYIESLLAYEPNLPRVDVSTVSVSNKRGYNYDY